MTTPQDLQTFVVDIIARHQMTIERLNDIVRSTSEPLEGNLLYIHHSFDPNPKNVEKQVNLVRLVRSLPVVDAVVVEVGFNAGHSALLMLASHPSVVVHAFDICEHAYTKPCYEVLAEAFPNRVHFIPGRSQHTMPKYSVQADLFHIDGDHSAEGAKADVMNAMRMIRDGRSKAWIIMDDICFAPLKALWKELHEQRVVAPPPDTLQTLLLDTTRQGIGILTNTTTAATSATDDEFLSTILPSVSHRGKIRNVLVIAPTDHGQDSLLAYLSKRLAFPASKSKISHKISPQTMERHQSLWLSLLLQLGTDTVLGTSSSLINLVAPPFYNTQMISECLPIVDGVLAVVDCGEGITDEFRRHFRIVCEQGLACTLFVNKIDKLQSLEPNDEIVYQRIASIVDECNEMMEGTSAPSLSVLRGDVVFGRGSLSVADSIGGWGFTVETMLNAHCQWRKWSDSQRSGLLPKMWGDHTIRLKQGDEKERVFTALVLRPLREAMKAIEDGADSEPVLGITVGDKDLVGNARRHDAFERWQTLAPVLGNAMFQRTPPPTLFTPTTSEPLVFYGVRCVPSQDNRNVFAFGRMIPKRLVPKSSGIVELQEDITTEGVLWMMNGQYAVRVSVSDLYSDDTVTDVVTRGIPSYVLCGVTLRSMKGKSLSDLPNGPIIVSLH